MSDAETLDHPPPTPTAGASAEAPADALAATLAVAFPSFDASEADLAEFAQVAPDTHLLEASGPPTPVDFEALENEVARTRVIYVRGAAAVPITALLAIGGALLFHMLFVGGFLLAIYLAVFRGGGDGTGGTARDAGGSMGGYMIAGDGPAGSPSISADIEAVLPRAGTVTTPPPSLPELADAAPTSEQIAAASLEPSPEDPTVIGIASGSARAPNIRPPAPRQPPIKTTPLVVAPPPRDPVAPISPAPTILASAGPKDRPAGSPHGGAGVGGDEDYGDEAIIPLSKDQLGTGGGGSGQKGGLDRGGSGANNPIPSILNGDAPDPGDAFRLNVPSQPTICKILVLADGSIGKVEVVHSCGQLRLDMLYVETIKTKWKFHPAYRNGKSYDATREVICNWK